MHNLWVRCLSVQSSDRVLRAPFISWFSRAVVDVRCRVGLSLPSSPCAGLTLKTVAAVWWWCWGRGWWCPSLCALLPWIW
ncbi:hypothetical protein PFLUV_G00125980 [Perca fluviatilis]|uniref:Uncharacterized protein n=1 Tax=Perca fluviatilis TaxID=8168 RepID=A0A6A5FAE5_PERFL|nr:hypothetical protein PFLUV_G00125980 [Perca fluviatilis]